MTTESPAILDRRVQLLSDAEGGRDAVCRLNELRQHPFIVLLGEPGIGKSTTLQTEAAAEGAHVLTVRELINAPPADTEAALFLDALDEYRIDGSPADKTYQLAYAIEAAGAPRWRLACRAEDWRKEADTELAVI